MITKPRKYQLEGIRSIERSIRKHGGGLLADDMGLGKTLQSLLIYFRSKSRFTPFVVVCPASLKWNWQEEIEKHLGLTAEVLSGTKPPKRLGFRTYRILIINFEILGYWLPFLSKLNPRFVVIDEAHRIKNRSTKSYQNVKALCDLESVRAMIPLTGTPLTNNPKDLFATVNLIWPEEFPSYHRFVRRYTFPELKPWGWVFKGARRVKELHRKLKRCGMVRRLKKDVLHELPPRSLTILPMKLSKQSKKDYDDIKQDVVQWLQRNDSKKVAGAKRAKAIVRMGLLRRVAAERKQDMVIAWIEQFLKESTEKLIVFGTHHSVLRPLHEHFPHSVLINGKVTGRKRHERVSLFKNQDSVRIAFCNYDAAGVGLNMQVSSNVLLVELPWNPALVEQAIARAERMGQKNSVQVTIAIAKDTIEESLCDVLQTKQRFIQGILDGTSKKSTLDIYETLQNILLSE